MRGRHNIYAKRDAITPKGQYRRRYETKSETPPASVTLVSPDAAGVLRGYRFKEMIGCEALPSPLIREKAYH